MFIYSLIYIEYVLFNLISFYKQVDYYDVIFHNQKENKIDQVMFLMIWSIFML